MNLGADREGGPRSGQARDFPRPETFRRLTIVGKTNPCKRVIRKLAPTVCGNITALRAVLLLQRGDISSGVGAQRWSASTQKLLATPSF